MAKKAKNEKQAAKSSPVFFKDVSTVRQYRDEKGRFISKQKAEEIGVAPVFKTVTKYRNEKGKIVSEEKVKKSSILHLLRRYPIKNFMNLHTNILIFPSAF
jgi:hypothetical protein